MTQAVQILLARGLQIFRTSRSVHNVRLVVRFSYAKSGNHSAEGGQKNPGKQLPSRSVRMPPALEDIEIF